MEIDILPKALYVIKGWLEAKEEGWNNDDHFYHQFSLLLKEYKELREVEPPEYSYEHKGAGWWLPKE